MTSLWTFWSTIQQRPLEIVHVHVHSLGSTPIPKLPYNWGLGQAVDMGNLHRYARAIPEWGRYWWRQGKTGEVFVRFTGMMPIISVQHPRYVKEALTVLKLDKFALLREQFKRAFGVGVFTSYGREWKHKRSTMSKVFTQPSVARLESAMVDAIGEAIQREFCSRSKRTEDAEGGAAVIYLDAVPTVSSMTLRVLCSTVFGMVSDELVKEINEIWDIVSVDMLNALVLSFALGEWTAKLPLPMNLRLRRTKARMIDIVDQMILRHLHIEEMGAPSDQLQNTETNAAAVDILAMHIASLDDPSVLIRDKAARQAIAEEQLVTLFAGFETTASTLTYCLYMLGLYPEYQRRLFEEIRSASKYQEINMSTISKMDFLNRFVNEVLRLHPAISEIDKEAPAGGVHMLDYFIPQDTMVSISVSMLHINPYVWGEDAEQFDPDRWLPERLAKYPGKDNLRYAFVPFSLGPRDCLGRLFAMQEINLALVSLIQKYHIELAMPQEEIDAGIIFAVTMRCSTLKLKLTERDNATSS